MSFVFPIFLWGTGLVAIPVWLHLSRRRKFKRIRVGSLRFLEKLQVPRKRIARIEELLLLLLRVSAIVILSLLFARPVITGSQQPDREDGETIVLLDASGSIGKEMAETVGKEGRRIVREATGSAGRDVTIARFADRVELLDRVEDYVPIHGAPTRFDRALDWAVDRILESDEGGAGRIVVVGHLSETALTYPFERVFPGSIELEVVPVDPPQQGNSFVSGIELLTPYRGGDMEVEVQLAISNEGSKKVYIETEGYREEKVVDPGEEWVRFRFRPTRSTVTGWAGIADATDNWPIDDRRPFAFHWVDRSKVLLVDGDPGDTPFDGETYFLRKALEASGAAHGMSRFDVDLVYGMSNRNGVLELGSYQSIALCDVHSLSEKEVLRLADFVAGGGGLLVLLGDRWDRVAYGRLSEAGLFPGNVDRIGGRDARRFGDWDRNFRAFSVFGEEALSDVEWAERIQIKASTGWTPVAKLDTGTTIMSRKGNVVVCAHPLNRDWSDLPRYPVFVPLVKGLFSAISKTEGPALPVREILPGLDELREPNWYGIAGEGLELVVPSDEESFVQTESRESFLARILSNPMDGEKGSLSGEKVVTASFPLEKEIWPWLGLLLLGWLVVEGIAGTASAGRTSDDV